MKAVKNMRRPARLRSSCFGSAEDVLENIEARAEEQKRINPLFEIPESIQLLSSADEENSVSD